MAIWRDATREAHRRSMWQVAGIYLAASRVVLQAVLALDQALGNQSGCARIHE